MLLVRLLHNNNKLGLGSPRGPGRLQAVPWGHSKVTLQPTPRNRHTAPKVGKGATVGTGHGNNHMSGYYFLPSQMVIKR